MIKITVIAVGKLKEKYFLAASEEYEKRLTRFCKLNIIEIEPEKLLDNPAEAQISAAVAAEGKRGNGVGHRIYIIGGSYGLSDEVKKRADERMSMSPMTFPHKLARIMLLEQIYRAFMILGGGTYHK